MSTGIVGATDAAAASIEVLGLHKQYGGRAALGSIDLTVRPGEIYFFIGPSDSWCRRCYPLFALRPRKAAPCW